MYAWHTCCTALAFVAWIVNGCMGYKYYWNFCTRLAMPFTLHGHTLRQHRHGSIPPWDCLACSCMVWHTGRQVILADIAHPSLRWKVLQFARTSSIYCVSETRLIGHTEHKSYFATCKLLQPLASWDILGRCSNYYTLLVSKSPIALDPALLFAADQCLAWLTSFDLFNLIRLPCQMLSCEHTVPMIMHSADCQRALQSNLHTVWPRPTLVGKAEKLSIIAMMITTGGKTR